MRYGRRRLGLTLAAALAAAPAFAGDALFYKEENGAIVFTNVEQRGVRPVPGFSARHRFKAAKPLPATRHDGYIRRISEELGVSSDLIKAVAMVESGFDPRARSPKGAQGLMQLMPATARRYGVRDPYDPWDNLRGGTAHLRDLLDAYDGDLTLTLAAYNAGAGAVKRYGGVPPYRETRNYVAKINDLLDGKAVAHPKAAANAPRREPAPVRVYRAADGTITLAN
jgi:soluble lytic murein transglycosylase-like protein